MIRGMVYYCYTNIRFAPNFSRCFFSGLSMWIGIDFWDQCWTRCKVERCQKKSWNYPQVQLLMIMFPTVWQRQKFSWILHFWMNPPSADFTQAFANDICLPTETGLPGSSNKSTHRTSFKHLYRSVSSSGSSSFLIHMSSRKVSQTTLLQIGALPSGNLT